MVGGGGDVIACPLALIPRRIVALRPPRDPLRRPRRPPRSLRRRLVSPPAFLSLPLAPPSSSTTSMPVFAAAAAPAAATAAAAAAAVVTVGILFTGRTADVLVKVHTGALELFLLSRRS